MPLMKVGWKCILDTDKIQEWAVSSVTVLYLRYSSTLQIWPKKYCWKTYMHEAHITSSHNGPKIGPKNRPKSKIVNCLPASTTTTSTSSCGCGPASGTAPQPPSSTATWTASRCRRGLRLVNGPLLRNRIMIQSDTPIKNWCLVCLFMNHDLFFSDTFFSEVTWI